MPDILFEYIGNIIAPETIITSLIVGYFIFLLLFHNLKIKQQLKEVEVLILSFIFGLIAWGVSLFISYPISYWYFLQTGADLPISTYNLLLIIVFGIILGSIITNENYSHLWKLSPKKRMQSFDTYGWVRYYLVLILFTAVFVVFGTLNPYYSIVSMNFALLMVISFTIVALIVYAFIKITFARQKISVFSMIRGIFGDKVFIVTLILIILVSSGLAIFSYPTASLAPKYIDRVNIVTMGEAVYMNYEEYVSRHYSITRVLPLVNWIIIPFNASDEPKITGSERVTFNKDRKHLYTDLTSAGKMDFKLIYSEKDTNEKRHLINTSSYVIYFEKPKTENYRTIFNITIENKENYTFDIDIHYQSNFTECKIVEPEDGKLESGAIRGYIEIHPNVLNFDFSVVSPESKGDFIVVIECAV